MRRGRAGRSRSGAGVSQEKSPERWNCAEVVCRGLERDESARGADRGRSARAVGLRAAGRHGNALRGRRTAGKRARAGVANKYVHHAVGIAIHQIHCGRKKRHVASVRGDGGRNTVAIGEVAVQANRGECERRHAARGRARARVPHKYVFRRSGNFRHTIGRSQHNHGVALVRAHGRCRERD